MNTQVQTTAERGSATLTDWRHWDLVLGFSADLLPVVCDTTAKPTPGSRILGFGKVPSEYAPDGRAHGIKGWQSRAITPADIARWSADRRYSMCVRCQAVRAIDCDITDSALADRVAAFIAARSALPKRIRGNASKFLLAFQFSGALKKRWIRTASGIIELLADGQQFVAAGRHPSGTQYEWVGGLPSEIPTLSADALESLWAELVAEFGVEPEVSASVERNASAALRTISPFQLVDLRSALAHPPLLDAARSNHTWSEIGYALLSLGEQGRDLWVAFSSRAANPNPGPQTAESWWTAHATQPSRSDFLHIFKMAGALGWTNPAGAKVARLEDFPVEDAVANGVQLIRGTSVTLEPIDWLWPGWLARGKLHIIAGAPGCGKTTLALAFAAALTNGGAWPDGNRAPVGNVIIWSGEDDPSDTLMPRLVAMGVDPSKVYFVGPVSDGEGQRAFDPACDLQHLRAAALDVGGASYLIVDPIVNAVSGDSHKNSETRRALQALVDLGTVLRAAVLGISHYTKGTAGRDPVERVTGSIAFGALPRIILGAAKVVGEDGSTSRILVRAKSNIGRDGGGYGYELKQEPLKAQPAIEASAVVWGEALEGTAQTLLTNAENANGDRITKRQQAVALIPHLLSEHDGEMSAKDLTAALDGAGIGRDNRRQALHQLGLKPAKAGPRGEWTYRLPDPPPDFRFEPPVSDGPMPPGDVQSRMLAKMAPKPEPSRLPAPTHPEHDYAGVLGEPVPESSPGCESPTLVQREPRHYVLATTEPRAYKAERHIANLRALGHESAQRIGDRVLVGPYKHERAAALLRDQLAASGFPHAKVFQQ